MNNKINGVSVFATTKQAFRAAAMACVFAGAALVSNGALAADISKNTSVIELTDGSGGFFSVFGKNNANGTFTDNYTFSIDELSSFSGISTSISTKPTVDLLELTGFKLTDSLGNVFNGTRVPLNTLPRESVSLKPVSSSKSTVGLVEIDVEMPLKLLSSSMLKV